MRKTPTRLSLSSALQMQRASGNALEEELKAEEEEEEELAKEGYLEVEYREKIVGERGARR